MENHLEYNTERDRLIIPEYGRHIQKMIDHAKTRKTKEERNKLAEAIIGVMGNLQPHLRDVPDFQHKLWDQLFIISDFQLDAETPYAPPSQAQLTKRPDPLSYPQNFPKYRFYGNNIKIMIDEVCKWEDGEKKEALMLAIANHMKKCFLNWNKDSVEDYIIFEHLFELSNGKIDLREAGENLFDSSSLLKNKRRSSCAKKGQKKHNLRRRNK